MKSYWWVNHNKNFISENTNNYLWSSKTSKGDRYNQYYMNMMNVHKDDIIISYAKGKIQSIGTVVAEAEEKESPYGSDKNVGWYVNVRWENLSTAMDPLLFYSKIKNLFPKTYSPLTEDGNGNRNCYLARISEELFKEIYAILVEYKLITGNIEVDEFEVITDDIIDINSQNIDETEKEQLILARKGQGKFREKLFERYKCCIITGVSLPSILIASHIKPWALSSNFERLDPNNGLLLSPHLDRLFDRYLISFSDEGKLLYSEGLNDVLTKWNLISTIKKCEFTKQTHQYLKFHREKFEKAAT